MYLIQLSCKLTNPCKYWDTKNAEHLCSTSGGLAQIIVIYVNCKLADVKQIRLHDFRHSCASLLFNKGANVQVVAKYLGHTKIEETLKAYSHPFTSTLDEVVAVIDNLDNNKTED